MIRLLSLLSLFALPAGATLAAATPWQDVAPGARLRLISSDVREADGTTLVGLELAMPQSFKTYWRLPGETGIPTSLDIGGSAGVAAASIDWPYPTPEVTQGYLDYVYHGDTVLPVRLRLAGPSPMLQAAVAMGVCSEVCVPVRASFSLPLRFAAADAAESIRLRQAEALAPIAWDGAAPAVASAAYDAGAHALRLTAVDPTIDPASIIASTADPTVIFDAPQKSPDGRTMVLPLRDKTVGEGWTKSPIQLTFMTPRGSFETAEQVTAFRP
jgi:DsbC/DsbD-like thiol-disulfide interchange protein